LQLLKRDLVPFVILLVQKMGRGHQHLVLPARFHTFLLIPQNANSDILSFLTRVCSDEQQFYDELHSHTQVMIDDLHLESCLLVVGSRLHQFVVGILQ